MLSFVVTDFNDNAPVWRQDSYTCRVSSEAQPGHIVSALTAHDPDVGETTHLRYGIHSGDRADIFKIDPLTGTKYHVINTQYNTT